MCVCAHELAPAGIDASSGARRHDTNFGQKFVNYRGVETYPEPKICDSLFAAHDRFRDVRCVSLEKDPRAYLNEVSFLSKNIRVARPATQALHPLSFTGY